MELACKLHARSVMYANKLVQQESFTRRAIENNTTFHSQVQKLRASSNPPDPQHFYGEFPLPRHLLLQLSCPCRQ
eukprot:1144886-Pelagomonas_calceolata.AAC.1